MASVQFDGGKLHGASEAKAMMRHADMQERLEHTHSNKDIDKSLTVLNSDLHDLSYREMCDLYDQRMQQYQKNSKRAIRKDAVTLYDAIVTVPEQLPEELEEDWFRDVENIINRHYGKNVVLDIKIHRDEVHDYTDPNSKQRVTSRIHGHVFMFPEIDGKLNAKQFSSRQNMMSLNRRIDKMTHSLYGCAFLTCKLAKDRDFQSVEQLKRASDNAELELQSRQIKSKLQDTHNKLSATQKALRDANKQLAAVSQQLQQQKAELHDISISVKKQKRKLNKLREYTNDVRSDLESLLANRDSVDKNELQRIEAEFSDVIGDLRQLVHYHDQFDAEQQLSDEQLKDYFSLMDKYDYAGRSDINCYADDRKEYEASYDYSAYDDEDLEL
jgi:hypothetical protein